MCVYLFLYISAIAKLTFKKALTPFFGNCNNQDGAQLINYFTEIEHKDNIQTIETHLQVVGIF